MIRMGKEMIPTIIAAVFLTFVVSLYDGCSYETEVVEKDRLTDALSVGENAEIPSLRQELEVVDEDFSLFCVYDTGKYDLEKWHVTDSKAVTMKVTTKNLPEGYQVYIDHVHADISLKSTSAQINGITQDSMDDTFHGYSQDGFYIDDETEYYKIFCIKGYTDQFYTLWGSAIDSSGTQFSSYKRLTEGNIINSGTYAEKLTVVYDLSIRMPGSENVYTKSVISEMLIPISQKVKKVKKDVFTGEVIEEDTQTEELSDEE